MTLTQEQIQNIDTSHGVTCTDTTPYDFYMDYVGDLYLNQEQDIYAVNGSVKSFDEYLQTNSIEDYATMIQSAIDNREYLSIISFEHWINRKVG